MQMRGSRGIANLRRGPDALSRIPRESLRRSSRKGRNEAGPSREEFQAPPLTRSVLPLSTSKSNSVPRQETNERVRRLTRRRRDRAPGDVPGCQCGRTRMPWAPPRDGDRTCWRRRSAGTPAGVRKRPGAAAPWLKTCPDQARSGSSGGPSSREPKKKAIGSFKYDIFCHD